MSAIFGIIPGKDEPLEQATADAMTASLHHRATNGSSVFYDGHILLGCHFLHTSRYPYTAPIPYGEGPYRIVADARIDNHAALAGQLGVSPDLPDAELILKAYVRWGDRCPEFLEGEFAFVIWDTRARTVFAATDPIGFRTFYYYCKSGRFLFASEIKGIQAARQDPFVFNPDALAEYFSLSSHTGVTFDRDIRVLHGASVLTIGTDFAPRVHRYWSLERRGKYRFRKDEDWVDCFRELLTRSVGYRLAAGVPAGIMLSGGLDSTFMAALTADILKKQNKPLYTFSNITAPEHDAGVYRDERAYIGLLTARYDNMIPTFVELPPGTGPLTAAEELCDQMECPGYAFDYANKSLFAAAREKNVRVLLSGVGGDYGVSSKGKDAVHRLFRQGRLLTAIRHTAALKKQDNSSWKEALKSALFDYSAFLGVYHRIRGWQPHTPHYAFSPELRELTRRTEAAGKRPGAGDMEQVISFIGSGIFGGKTFNTRKKMTGHYGLEGSDPILDPAICEFVLDLPPEQLILHGTRRSLTRRAMDGLVPERIQMRPDKGRFSPDFFKRFQDQRPRMEAMLADNSYRQARTYIDGQMLRAELDAVSGKAPGSAEANTQARAITRIMQLLVFLRWAEKRYKLI